MSLHSRVYRREIPAREHVPPLHASYHNSRSNAAPNEGGSVLGAKQTQHFDNKDCDKGPFGPYYVTATMFLGKNTDAQS